MKEPLEKINRLKISQRQLTAVYIGLASSLADRKNISFWFAIHLLFRAKNSLFIFCTYLRLWVRYWADVRAKGTLNARAAAGHTVGCKFLRHLTSFKIYNDEQNTYTNTFLDRNFFIK